MGLQWVYSIGMLSRVSLHIYTYALTRGLQLRPEIGLDWETRHAAWIPVYRKLNDTENPDNLAKEPNQP